jgi:hypothetical protein
MSVLGVNRLEDKSPYCHQPGEQEVWSELLRRIPCSSLNSTSPACERLHGYPVSATFHSSMCYTYADSLVMLSFHLGGSPHIPYDLYYSAG